MEAATGNDPYDHDETSCLPSRFEVRYWPWRTPERKGEVIGCADTLGAAWSLVRDREQVARGIGWLWILDRETGHARFALLEPRRGLSLPLPNSEFQTPPEPNGEPCR